MGSIGPMEMAIVLVLALLVFGPKKLPEIGKGMGEAMREFKKASRDLMSSFHEDPDQRPYSAPPSHTEPFSSATPEPIHLSAASGEGSLNDWEPAAAVMAPDLAAAEHHPAAALTADRTT
jgi:sec-independent protein translocase protein TatA